MIKYVTSILAQPVAQKNHGGVWAEADRCVILVREADRVAHALYAAGQAVNSAQYPELYKRLTRAWERAEVRVKRRTLAERAAWDAATAPYRRVA